MKEITKESLACECGCGLMNASSIMLIRLNLAQQIYGEDFKINSGSRCQKHNEDVGGEPNSAHLTGEAVDLRVYGSYARKKVAKALDASGFPRIGLAKGFVHGDISITLPEGWWTY